MLIILGGLPGTGNTNIARAFCQATSAVHIRIDSIERAIRESGVTVVSLDDAGYRAGYAVAEDNLRLGHVVVADSVNSIPITRAAWLEVAALANARGIEVEVRCTEVGEHRQRIEARVRAGIGPTWQQVVDRDYSPWTGAAHSFDTATLSVDQVVARLRAALGL